MTFVITYCKSCSSNELGRQSRPHVTRQKCDSLIAINFPQRINQAAPHRRLCNPSLIVSIVTLMGLCYLAGCATPKLEPVLPNRDATIGKTKEALLQCAGQPIREAVQNHNVIFLYYKEAPMLQESFSGSKGSFPRPHHGCWASVLLEDDRVTDIGYRSVPRTIDALDHCEAIFETCHP